MSFLNISKINPSLFDKELKSENFIKNAICILMRIRRLVRKRERTIFNLIKIVKVNTQHLVRRFSRYNLILGWRNIYS